MKNQVRSMSTAMNSPLQESVSITQLIAGPAMPLRLALAFAVYSDCLPLIKIATGRLRQQCLTSSDIEELLESDKFLTCTLRCSWPQLAGTIFSSSELGIERGSTILGTCLTDLKKLYGNMPGLYQAGFRESYLALWRRTKEWNVSHPIELGNMQYVWKVDSKNVPWPQLFRSEFGTPPSLTDEYFERLWTRAIGPKCTSEDVGIGPEDDPYTRQDAWKHARMFGNWV